MGNVKEFFLRIYDFLVANDFPTLLENIRQMEWTTVARSAYTWLIALPLLIYLLWTKKFKFLISLVTFGLFIILLQFTLSPPDVKQPLSDLLTFLAGASALVGLNLYLYLVRD